MLTWDLGRGSLADSIELCLPHLHAPLVDGVAAQRLCALGRQLPPLISHTCFEVRLGTDAPRVDLSAGVQRGPTERALFAHLAHTQHWPLLDDIARDWNAGAHGAEAITQLYCEFDLDEDAATVPLPSIFVQLDSRAPVETSFDRLLARFAASAAQRAAVARCVRALPHPSHLKFMGLMLPRPGAPVRLNVDLHGATEVRDFLSSVNWSGDWDAAEDTLAWIAEFGMSMVVAVDVVDTGITPNVGFECWYRGTDHAKEWVAVFEDLTERGACDPAKRAAVLAWPGWATSTNHAHAWPAHLRLPQSWLGPGRINAFQRMIGHVKLSCTADAVPADVKAYLFFSHQWLDTNHDGNRIDARRGA